MWLKNDGFLLPEILLTMSAWLVIATVIIPLIVNVKDQSVHLKQEFHGTKVLYEALLRAKKDEHQPQQGIVILNQTSYEIYLGNSEENKELEVCVKFENVYKKLQTKCEIYK